jgi:hypothetical protein
MHQFMKLLRLVLHFGILGRFPSRDIIRSTSFASRERFDHGGAPCVISMETQPSDQISAMYEWPTLLTTSGAIQYGLPFSDFAISLSVISNRLELPKSVSFTTPS